MPRKFDVPDAGLAIRVEKDPLASPHMFVNNLHSDQRGKCRAKRVPRDVELVAFMGEWLNNLFKSRPELHNCVAPVYADLFSTKCNKFD